MKVFHIGLLGLILTGCAPTLTTEMILPARSATPKLKRIAVLPFESAGTFEDDASTDVEAMLVKIESDDKPVFEVIERGSLGMILQEQSLGQSGAIDASSAARIGAIAGANGIIFGKSGYNRSVTRHSATRSKCVDEKCSRLSEYEVSCSKLSITYVLQAKVVETSTAKIVASETIGGQSSASGCEDEKQIDAQVVAQAAKANALSDLRKVLGPYSEKITLTLLTSDNSNMGDSVKAILNAGVRWAKQGRIDRAKDLWQDAYALHQTGYALPYLLGLCSEIAGDFDSAQILFKEADARTTAPVSEITAALGRIKTRIRDQEKIESQMAADQPTPAPSATTTVSPTKK